MVGKSLGVCMTVESQVAEVSEVSVPEVAAPVAEESSVVGRITGTRQSWPAGMGMFDQLQSDFHTLWADHWP